MTDHRRVSWLFAILVLSALLNFWNNDFPLGYHADEPVKVRFVKTGTQDFKHPILLLQLTKAVTRPLGIFEDQDVAIAGRSIQAAAMTGAVLVMWLIARRTMAPAMALGAAASVAVSPIVVMHAHYMKEDTLLTLCLLLSVLALIRYVERPVASRAVVLGVASGLAFASHYKSILLVPLFAAAPFFGALGSGSDPAQPHGGRWLPLTRHFLIAGLVATAVFLVINWPLVLDLRGFLAGPGYELQHAIEGEDARYRISDFWFTFHLQRSLVPGMGWTALVVGLAGVAWATYVRPIAFQDRLLLAYLAIFYFIPEASPLKSERYMLPVAPVLLYFGWRAVDLGLQARRSAWARRVLAGAAVSALMLYPGYRSVRLVSSIANDTRARASAWLRAHPGKAIVEQYATLEPNTWMAADIDPSQARRDGVNYVVVSSFIYDRYLDGATLSNQEPEIYRLKTRYEQLFSYPYVEIAPDFETYEFNNPVVRIVDIRKEPGLRQP